MLADLPTAPWFRRLIVAGFLLGILLLTFHVLQPFIVPLIWGGILAYVFWPLNRRLLALLKDRTTLAALSTTLLATAVLLAPLTWLLLALRTEALAAYDQVQAFLASKPALPKALQNLPGIGPWLQDMLHQMSVQPDELRQQLRSLAEQSSTQVKYMLGSIGRNATKMFFSVLSMFFLLRDGPRVLRETRAILEGVLGQQVRNYIDAVSSTTQAVVYALILGALAQGAAAGVGYWIFGVQAPAFLGAVTALIALVPFGAPVIWGGIALWLLLTDHIYAGVGLLAWGILLVSWIDNIVRPLVISNATHMPFLLVVFGVLGGVIAFGLVGLFMGPVLLAIVLALWREWLEQHQLPADSSPR